MTHSPLAQFEVKYLVPQLGLTNATCTTVLVCLAITAFLNYGLRKASVLPSRLQMSVEMWHNMIASMVEQNIGVKGKPFLPLVLTIFSFILTANLFGMIPYGFTITSHLSVTFVISSFVFFLMLFVGLFKHGLHFFSLFLPKGTPWWLVPLMIVIELFAFLAKPVSLALRLTANMVAGHVLLKVMAGFVLSAPIFANMLPIPFITVLIGFEIFVAVLQAYIFSILTCVYLSDSINLH
ncbi:ATP synthase subunit a [Rickettsiales endosymbiont of Paramecium tredecaurelia]|uniref:F0F1 ATP synthase subunit A n=1 Tax=Candidatus Sarmatiella mevalonica TaxID=2770581 RepID=UPI00192092FD|nr:F0F1 ATP synthase subunit A [Candidatus Sarmatiella mevalonica]MBL3285197.1 ATP synthase subunit a [Candidatus Sarmatiella mevalonica]